MRLSQEPEMFEVRRYPTHTAVLTIDGYDIGLILDPETKTWHYEHARSAVRTAGFAITPELDEFLKREFKEEGQDVGRSS